MKVFAISIKSTNKLGYNDLSVLFDMIPRSFSNTEYMQGFLQGLCFGEQIVQTLVEWEERSNSLSTSPQKVKFVYIED